MDIEFVGFALGRLVQSDDFYHYLHFAYRTINWNNKIDGIFVFVFDVVDDAVNG